MGLWATSLVSPQTLSPPTLRTYSSNCTRLPLPPQAPVPGRELALTVSRSGLSQTASYLRPASPEAEPDTRFVTNVLPRRPMLTWGNRLGTEEQ